MKVYLEAIDTYINSKEPDFWGFYSFFQDQYFGDKNIERNSQLKEDETIFLDEINDEMSMVGSNPNPQERKEGIRDQYQFRDWLTTFKEANISIWKFTSEVK